MALQHQHQPWPRRVVRNPRILGGEPIIEGTRVPVRTIVEATRYLGDVDEIISGYPMLDRASIASALEFYRHHKAEIDRYIAENQDLTA